MAALIEAGVITDEAIDDHLMVASRTARQRRPEEMSVRLWSGDDKYAIPDPGIDCEARMHLCQGRCCSFDFPLSEQDLDEGQVRWRHHQPYMIAQREDGYCVHNDRATRGCGVYGTGPAPAGSTAAAPTSACGSTSRRASRRRSTCYRG